VTQLATAHSDDLAAGCFAVGDSSKDSMTLATVILERKVRSSTWLGSGAVEYYLTQIIPTHREAGVSLELRNAVSVLRRLDERDAEETVHTTAISVGRGVHAVLADGHPLAIAESGWALALWSGDRSVQLEAFDSDLGRLGQLVLDP
jgi:hypothetical protein